MIRISLIMIRVSSIIISLSLFVASADVRSHIERSPDCDSNSITGAQSPLRIALIGFVGSGASNQASAISRRLIDTLEATLEKDERVSLIEPSLLTPALAGVGYAGSINMSKDEARRIGAAIGCDFFITGKAETVTRSERKDESHEESYAGVMIVNARTGALALFDFLSEKSQTQQSSLLQLAKALQARAGSYVERLIEHRARRVSIQLSSSPSADRIEEMPAEGSLQSAGFTPPEFLNRAKPQYTTEAESADISATVEASAVFRANGEVGEIEIIRWAGFNLDQSAERAIRQLKFKPATRDGMPTSVRAIVQYNFRRKS